MKIIAIGLNHKSAPVDIRERLAFDQADTLRVLGKLKGRFAEAEFVLLSTCNRVELYSVIPSLENARGPDGEDIASFLLGFHGLELDDFRDFLYIYQGSDAVRHLLKVVSSLDSMVVGESQIIAQTKDSYRLACTAKSAGSVLHSLFHSGFATSKKVHTTTDISSGRVSVAGVAVELAKQLFAKISSAKVAVIGAGEMGQLLVKHFLHIGCRDVTVVNRSYERAMDMADRYGIKGQKWDQLGEQLNTADIVVAAVGVQDYLFEKRSFKEIINKRRGKPLLIIDIAVPRNFEPAVSEIEEVYLYSIDDLSVVVEQNQKARQEDMARGMQIIDEAVSNFMDWFRAKDIGPLIGQVRQKFAQMSQEEQERFFAGAKEDTSCKTAGEPMVKRVVNRMLYRVIKNIDTVAQKQGPDEAVKMLNGIIKKAEEISCGSKSNEDTQL